MKRITQLTCLLLILALLAGCGGKQEASPLQPLLDQLAAITDQTRNMTDAELSDTIQSMAGEHRLTLNDEQLQFLISACRSLETADNVSRTAKELSDQLNKIGKAAKTVTDGVGKAVDTVTDLLN